LGGEIHVLVRLYLRRAMSQQIDRNAPAHIRDLIDDVSP
jgi:hypothetical protein